MHKNNAQQQDHYSVKDFSLEPITLTYNKRLLDHKKKQIMFNQSMKKIPQQDFFNQNQQLICQLYSLIGNEEVKKNMNEQLMDRVQKILNDAQIQNSNNSDLIEDQKSSSVSKSWKHFEDKQKNSNQGLIEKNSNKNNLEKATSNFEITRTQNSFSHKKSCRQNKQNYEHRGTFNLKKDSQNLRVKNKKIVNTQNSQSKYNQNKIQKRLKSVQSENGLTYVSSSKKLQNKIKQDVLSIGKQRSEQKNNSNKAPKPQPNLKYPYSLNTTIFTTRNLQEEIKKQKKENYLSSKSSQKQKKQKQNRRMKNKKNNNEQIRHLTEQQKDEEEKGILFRTGTSSDEQLFAVQGNEKIKIKKDKCYNENHIQSHTLLGQVYSKQFISTICKLQKDAVNQQEQLERKIKELKILISSENYAIQIKRVAISKIKDEQNMINTNNGLISNKKKQVHKKLQSMWGQVKLLNSNILQIQKQNSQIKASVDEEKQLISMYTTVIEELKEQLKIEVDYRDQYKKKLNFSKKNQLVSKMKANCTKGHTQLIMNNIRDSIGKWIS